MFEVGKKYRNKVTTGTWTCVYIGLSQAVLESSNGFLDSVPVTSPTFVPYVGPRSGTAWLSVHQSGFRPGKFSYSSYPSREDADKYTNNRLACIEVLWAEGDGLNV